MTTLVTGGIGWVPSHICRALAEAGETVIAFDLMEPDGLFNELLGDFRVRVQHVSGDVTDTDQLERACRDAGVTAIIHAAAITPRRDREMREPARIIDVNLGGTVNALEVARNLPGFRRFVSISSGAAIGLVTGVDLIDETTPSAATNLYGITKHTSERVVSRYRALFDLSAVSVRLADVFGPMERETPGYVGATELREMLRIHFAGEPVRINSLDGPWLDWTYVGDIAEGVRVLWNAPELPNDLYTITCGVNYSMGNVLEAFQRHLPDFRYSLVPAAESNYLVSGGEPEPLTSNQRMKDDFDWEPRTTFDEGMRLYLDWITRHGPH